MRRGFITAFPFLASLLGFLQGTGASIKLQAFAHCETCRTTYFDSPDNQSNWSRHCGISMKIYLDSFLIRVRRF